jgi:predicted enzyme related to lactoylglutathione lyase
MNTQTRNFTGIQSASAPKIDMKLEVVVIPVTDVGRAKQFYGDRLGWRLDADFAAGDTFRVVQFTPPGSPSSIHFGKGITSATPGSARVNYLVVSDIEAARAELVGRGVNVSEVTHRAGPPGTPQLGGRHPERQSYSSFATFSDPDGNGWLLQEVTERLPGRVDAAVTAFASTADLASALRRAAAAHGEHEKRVPGRHDQTWPDWYAEYMAAEQAGKELPQ